LTDFSETLLRSESTNSGYLGAHEGINSRYLHERDVQPETSRAEKALDGPPSRRDLTKFDSRDHGLGRTGPRGEGALAEPGSESGGAEKSGEVGFHPYKIADKLSRGRD
jgi:hypothetical protein